MPRLKRSVSPRARPTAPLQPRPSHRTLPPARSSGAMSSSTPPALPLPQTPRFGVTIPAAAGGAITNSKTTAPTGPTASPCDPANPNAYVGVDSYLHIVARQPTAGSYTSSRMRTQGLFSFQYGRLEYRAQVPEAQGFWPAGWLLGNNITTINWPGCGEQDVLERVNAATNPDFNQGSVHGPGFTGTAIGSPYYFPTGQTAATWHTYGMIWKPGSVAYYVDDPTNIYAPSLPAAYPRGQAGFRRRTGKLHPAQLRDRRQLPWKSYCQHAIPSRIPHRLCAVIFQLING